MAEQTTNVIAIAAGGDQSLALLSNGTVTNWGASYGAIPAMATNVTAIAAGTNFSLVLRSNGTVIAWGDNANGQTNVPSGLSNVVAIAAGGAQALALRSDGTVTNWGATSGSIPATLTNAMGIAAGYAHAVALRNDATVVAWGNNSGGQTNVPAWFGPVKLIAAGGNQSLASIFSPLLQYPVDVSKDLLLIYNSASSNSVWVKDYYLANRPLVSRANVMGVGCPLTETIFPQDYTNTIQSGASQWLSSHPTLRPQYVVLFLDVPSRVNGDNTNGYSALQIKPSVSYQLHTDFPGWRPFVTHINMGDTNDCIDYINKLAVFGTNGQLFISASAGGYGNTNYYFDDNRDHNLYGTGPSRGNQAKNGVLSANPLASVTYVTNYLSPHITNAVNVAGYMSWGHHSSWDIGLPWEYATNGAVKFTGNSRWYLIQTIESVNGFRDNSSSLQGFFLQWFSMTGFGGTNYSNTPIGAVTHVDEPGGGLNDSAIYFGLWEHGIVFASCAWNSRRTPYFQAVGDPFVRR
jgi:hypothetical protein